MKKLTIFRLIFNWIKRTINKIILWTTAKFFAIMITIFISILSRARMSHNNGIAAKGTLRIVDDPKFMDLEMNTGPISLFWSAVSFLKFGKLRKEKWGVEYVDYIRQYPEGYEGAVEAVRRQATSFHNLRYYAKTPFLFTGSDDIKRYAKYRVLPFEDIPESGIDDDPSFWDMSNQRVLPHTKHSRNYLKEEYENKVKKGAVNYRLQIQTRIASDDDPNSIFNNMIVWDEKIYPWHDLAFIEIEETLDWKESTLMAFSVNNMPKSLGVIPATSIFDYNSLNYMRAHSEMARKARLFSYKIFGMVPPIPNNDNRNVDVAMGNWGK